MIEEQVDTMCQFGNVLVKDVNVTFSKFDGVMSKPLPTSAIDHADHQDFIDDLEGVLGPQFMTDVLGPTPVVMESIQ